MGEEVDGEEGDVVDEEEPPGPSSETSLLISFISQFQLSFWCYTLMELHSKVV